MSGRFRTLKTWADLRGDLQRFVGPVEQAVMDLESCQQVRPTNDAAIVRTPENRLLASSARWWLVPWFHKGALKDWKRRTGREGRSMPAPRH
jgi:putative SOS response-associated peptidase YedK